MRHGIISYGSHTTTSRSLQRADNCTVEIQVVGDYNDLEDLILTKGVGEDASSLCTFAGGDVLSGYKIKTLSVAREEGAIGVLSASLVKARSLSDPYHITYTIEMLEDQRDLLRHPLFRTDVEAFKIIRLWNDTPIAKRVQYSNNNPMEDKFFYEELVKNINPGESGGQTDGWGLQLKEIVNQVALKYCRAFVAGIERFNVYLPVITKTSLYLKQPPGGSQNTDTHELSGTLNFSTGIGKWDSSFGFTLKGYEDTQTQGWFKNTDGYTQNSDGTWQRNEQWTFSDAKTHSWIYENA